IELDAYGGEIELVGAWAPARRDENVVDADLLDARRPCELDRDVRPAPVDGLDRRAELERDAGLAERLLDELARARVLLGEHARLGLDQHDVDAEARERLRELAADRPRTDDAES